MSINLPKKQKPTEGQKLNAEVYQRRLQFSMVRVVPKLRLYPLKPVLHQENMAYAKAFEVYLKTHLILVIHPGGLICAMLPRQCNSPN